MTSKVGVRTTPHFFLQIPKRGKNCGPVPTSLPDRRGVASSPDVRITTDQVFAGSGQVQGKGYDPESLSEEAFLKLLATHVKEGSDAGR